MGYEMIGMKDDVQQRLQELIAEPSLSKARKLQETLFRSGYHRQVFGRINQMSSIEGQASDSDRGIMERLSNAYDASLKAARTISGKPDSSHDDSPRINAARYFGAEPDTCVWMPKDTRINIAQPFIQFWHEAEQKRLNKKHNPNDGLVTVLVGDNGVGIHRLKMRDTILTLNSDSKLSDFDAVGQFGHGGSSSLHFCESSLIMSSPRFEEEQQDFYWTLIYEEPTEGTIKQTVIRKWYSEEDGHPLIAKRAAFEGLQKYFPGTLVWHFGYSRGGWIKPISGPGQSNPWGRLGRLFFSYPLPFKVVGDFARQDTARKERSITGAFFRIIDSKDKDGTEKVDYRASGKRETLYVDGSPFGEFNVNVLVLKEKSDVTNYVDTKHPVILTLHGQNHGEMTENIMLRAMLPELSVCTIIEVRLENLEQEALANIISSSRETPKRNEFTRELEKRLIDLLAADEGLRRCELLRQEQKAKHTSAGLSNKMRDFLVTILSDAIAEPDTGLGGSGIGGKGIKGKPRPEIVPHDPPTFIEFIYDSTVYVPEGAKRLVKFKSDGRPPKYTFEGDNARCFVKLELDEKYEGRLTIVGSQDIDGQGYGTVTVYCLEDPKNEIAEEVEIGKLRVWIQSADGTLLEDRVGIGLKPRPEEKEKKQKPSVFPEIILAAPKDEDIEYLKELLVEEEILTMASCSYLPKFQQHLGISPEESTYWGVRSDKDGASKLIVEINVGNPQFVELMKTCNSIPEKSEAKERYVRDVLLDCYQHCFAIEDLPEGVKGNLDNEEAKRAVDMYLNHDKAIRLAIHERQSGRRKGA